jgi:hypothetical protein
MEPRLPAASGGWSLASAAAPLRALAPRSKRRVLGFAMLPLLLALAVAQAPVNPEFLFSDLAGFTGLPPYFGVFSHLGVLAWWGTGVACLLCAWAIPAGRERMMMLLAAGLAALLALDDLFMLHERVLPYFGIAEELMLAGYACLGVAYLVAFRDIHLRLEWPLLLAALALLGTSVAVDVALAYSPATLILEEATKFAGIIAWTAYHGLAVRDRLRCAAR